MNALTRELRMFSDAIEQKNPEKNTGAGDPWRLSYHVMPPVGWLNDPNGLCQLGGVYHLFFQYSPSNPCGALKYWGHYVSTDLISWEYTGIALYPDMPYDCHGVYSGSALVENDKAYLYYTGNVKLSGDYDYIYNGREGNTALAVMDKDGTISEKTLILKNSDYPEHLSCHVRDPKVWKENGRYYMVLGARTLEDKGCVLVYGSDDKYSWAFENILEKEKPFGYMWECPDMFVLDGARILGFSPQGVDQEGINYANIYQSGYCVLEGDFTGACELKPFFEYDRGFDFYAPQTFEDVSGRRILIGWMGMADCDYTNPTVAHGWQHCMTVPRELRFKDGRIYQTPVQELEKLRQSGQTVNVKKALTIKVNPASELYMDFGKVTEICKEAGTDADVKPSCEAMKMVIDGSLILSYNSSEQSFTMAFEDDPNGGNIGYGRTSRKVSLERLDNMRILLDTSAIEVYLNDGLEVFSSRMYPQAGQTLSAHTVAFVDGRGELTVWKLEL